jgi:hypothetical protein
VQTWVLALIAAIAALIAYLQWITAHQKIVLELFDKRFDAFQKVVSALTPVYVHASITQEQFFEFVRAMERCRFLFGDEIYEFLAELKKDLSFLLAFTDEAIDRSPQRHEFIKKKTAILIRIADFDKIAVPKFMPYMRLDQKMKYFWSSSLGKYSLRNRD